MNRSSTKVHSNSSYLKKNNLIVRFTVVTYTIADQLKGKGICHKLSAPRSLISRLLQIDRWLCNWTWCCGKKDVRHRRVFLPSDKSVSWGVVALDTENPPLSKMDASSSDNSESVMAMARAVVFTSTWVKRETSLRTEIAHVVERCSSVRLQMEAMNKVALQLY